MKLFGNTKRPEKASEREKELSFESTEQFNISEDDEFDKRLKLLLDGEELSDAEQLTTAPPKTMEQPINTDYHLAQDPIRGTRVIVDDEEDEEEAPMQMAGWLKGTLLLLASIIVLVLTVFGVYVNLI